MHVCGTVDKLAMVPRSLNRKNLGFSPFYFERWLGILCGWCGWCGWWFCCSGAGCVCPFVVSI